MKMLVVQTVLRKARVGVKELFPFQCAGYGAFTVIAVVPGS